MSGIVLKILRANETEQTREGTAETLAKTGSGQAQDIDRKRLKISF
jgi:hypothetical protein